MPGTAFIMMLHLARIYDMGHATNKTERYSPTVPYLE